MTTTAAPAVSGLTFNAAIGWGLLFLILVAGTDVPALQTPAAMLAWLFLVSILFKYGPQAFGTVTSLNTTSATTGHPPIGGKVGAGKTVPTA